MMNELPKQPDQDLNGLDDFERQLRALAPRKASFHLPEHPTVAAKPLRALRETPGNRAWVMSFLVTWSLGAAAGVAGTLVTLRFVTPSMPAKGPMAQFNTPTDSLDQPPELSPDVDDNQYANSSNSESAVEKIDPPQTVTKSNSPSTRAEMKVSASNTWPEFSWQTLGFDSSAQVTLTPISLATNLRAELAADAGRDFRSADSETPTSVTTGEARPRNIGVPLETLPKPAKLRQLPPTSQRDLLRDLLSTYGAI